ncbi:MAG TPA: hypothetical protein VKB51_07165 [bacterium]|nr:hypothetical protein [bacterium]
MASKIPEGAYLKDISAQYNHLTIPRHLRLFSPLDPEMWGQVVVSEGEVDLMLEGQREPIRCMPEAPGVIPVDTPFRIESTGKPARFQIHYYHEPKLRDEGELASLLSASSAERHRTKA